jgi:diacylglycerol O-acyltransferase / wax synthase
VSDPVTVAEASLLARDQEAAPWQQALVLVVSGGLSREQLLVRIGERIGYAPRFRRVVAGWPVPGWIDDVNFNLAGHVSEVSLTSGQRLEDWLEECLAVPLSRSHPLWEVTVVNGLAQGLQAVVARIHPGLVDGYDHIHLFQELLDDEPEDVGESTDRDWQASESTGPDLGTFVAGLGDPLAAAERVAAGVLGMVENGVRTLTAEPRRHHLGHAEVDVDAVDQVRLAFGCSTHDVLVCLATAGLRGWLAEQGRPLVDELALVPLAVTEPQVLESAIGCRIAASFDRLPVTAPTPADRLAAIATMSRARRDSGVSVAARDLIELAGFAPATLHAVAAGAVGAGRPHALVICNVPGPTEPRYLGSARVRQVFAVTATTDAEQLSISITSYRGRVSLAVAALAPVTTWAASIAAELAALRSDAS